MEMVSKTKLIDAVTCLFLLWLCYLAFFRNLGLYSLRQWDEGRNAVNAFEMLKNQNWLVTTYLGKPDLWNTKPPLLIWMQSLSFAVFGISELSFRLPSAISATLTVLIVYLFGSYGLRHRTIGVLASLMLLSTMGFSDIHGGRSGDYDALLVLWTTCGFFYQFLFHQYHHPAKLSQFPKIYRSLL